MDQIRTREPNDPRHEFAERLAHLPGLIKQKTKAGETFLVSFDGPDDPESPQNWPLMKKFQTCLFYGLCCVCSTFASGIMSPATPQISHRFHISNEVSTLSTSTLFLLGYVAGPFAWAPLSESRGRKFPMMISMFGFICFGAMTATAKDYQTLAICRFLQGAMGACSITTTTASYADMFSVYHRGYATTAFAFTVFSGPMLASPIGGFTVLNKSLGWRWCCWWTVFTGAGTLVGTILFASESYAPYLLKRKAVGIRVETGEWAVHAKIEERHLPIQQMIKDIFQRPVIMLIQEPILLLISVYTAFVYALLYTFLVSYSIVFRGGYKMNPGVAGLPFFGVILGLLIAALANINQQRYYTKWVKENNGVLIPEWRMPIAMTGSVLFPIGLFFFAWTGAYPEHVHWIVPTVSGLITGYGLLMIFMSFFTYLIDVYKTNSASAFAAATIIRSGLAAGFPMFATQMFNNLGVNWGNTLLACLSLLLVPVPFCFWIWGAKIRARSSFVPDDAPPSKQPAQLAEDEEKGEGQDALDRELARQLSGESNWLGSTYSNAARRPSAAALDQWMSRAMSRATSRATTGENRHNSRPRLERRSSSSSRSSLSTAVVDV